MKLLNRDGSPRGISFRQHRQHDGYVIRVNGGGQQTDLGVTPESITTAYERAIDKRLELIGESDNADAWQTLASAYGAFLTHYNIGFKPITIYEFDIKE
jgi:hypothetical protein